MKKKGGEHMSNISGHLPHMGLTMRITGKSNMSARNLRRLEKKDARKATKRGR